MSNFSSKALSPLVATILLVAFALGVASFVGDWFSSYAKENINRASTPAQSMVDCYRQMIEIISVKQSDGNTVYVRVGNYGQMPVVVRKVIAYNYTDMQPCLIFDDPKGVPLDRGAERTFVNSSCPSGYGEVYLVRVTTSCKNVYDEWTANE